MKTWKKWAIAGAGAIAAYQLIQAIADQKERTMANAQALAYCRKVGKPYLVIGMKHVPWDPASGDVTLDINPAVLKEPGGVVGDIRKMSFGTKQFGACYCPHVLEHMYTEGDVRLAVSECMRVADRAVFLCPSPYNLVNLIHPTHHLRIWFDEAAGLIEVGPNTWRTPILIGTDKDRAPASVKQVIWSDNGLRVIGHA